MKRQIKSIFWKFDHTYTSILVISLVSLLLIGSWMSRVTNFTDNPGAWPAIAIFGAAPFIVIWSTIRLIRSYGVKRPLVLPSINPLKFFSISPSRQLADQLEAMKEIVDGQFTTTMKSAKRFELLGQFATVLAIGMPLTTWIYAFLQASSKIKLEHLWSFIFASSSFGFVAVTVAVTFLRHSKTHLAEANKYRAYSDSIHRVRVALLTDTPTIGKETLEVLAKYAKVSGGSGSEEPQPQSSEELKNAFSMVTSLLSKN